MRSLGEVVHEKDGDAGATLQGAQEAEEGGDLLVRAMGTFLDC
jgi:hypothetical protein